MSRIKVDTAVNKTATGPVDFPSGITGVAATFTGNVTVGGTITYDDVQNVDSVGVVTAGKGLRVTDEGIVVTAGVSTFSANVSFPDSVKLLFGTGNDMKISHDGSNSYIESDTGDLVLGAGNGTAIKLQPEGGEDGLTVTHNGAVEAYYDNSKKFETTSDGINVTGSAGINTSSPRAKLDVRGTVTLGGGQLAEKFATSGTALNSATSIDLDDGMVHYRSANLGAASVKPNITSSVGINTQMATGDCISVTIITAVNSTSNFVNALMIDHTDVTESWVGGSAPSAGGGSGYDTYAFNILKTGNATYVVIGNHVKTS